MDAIPVSMSEQPLVFDALPAMKVRHYTGRAALGNIYTFARLYACRQSLALSLCVFEEKPDDASMVGFALRGEEEGRYLQAGLSPAGLSLSLWEQGACTPLEAPEVSRFAGNDEQGWSWGGNFTLPAQALARAGVTLGSGGRFWAAVVKYRSDEAAFGCSYRPQEDEKPFNPARFEPCVLVSY